MTSPGFLKVEYIINELGDFELVDCKIDGNKHLFSVSQQDIWKNNGDISFIGPGDKFFVGPYRLIVVSHSFPEPFILVTTSKFRYFIWRYMFGLWRLLKSLQWKILMTLTIWGLAEYKPGVSIGWQDIYLVRLLGRAWRSIDRLEDK